MSLLYCYGVVEEDISLDIKGFNEVFTISFKDIIAVVSSVSEENFAQEVLDNNVKNMKWLTLNAPIHEKVVTKVMEKTTIIPMKFCTIFTTKEHLLGMLEEKYGDLKFNLNSLKDKIEMNVKVYVDFDEIKTSISDPEIMRLEEEVKQKTPGQAYMLQQKIDLLTKGRIQEKLHVEKIKILDKLTSFSENIKENNLLDRKGKEMFLNVAILISKNKEDKENKENKNNIENLNNLIIDPTDTKFEYEITGPFAPYNFVR